MLTHLDIKQMAYPQTYSKGINLYKKGHVLQSSVAEEEGMDHVIAYVRGSGQNLYTVKYGYDVESDNLVYGDCDCPAFENYEGLCKHLVAALLAYAASDDSVKSPVVVKRSTTPGIKDLLKTSSRERITPLFQEKLTDPVKIEPCIHIQDYSIHMDFKIGNVRMYVLKDLMLFYHNMKMHLHHEYGKQLAFIHGFEVFDEESKKVAEYIVKTVEANRRHYEYGYSSKREIKLTTDTLADYLKESGSGHIRTNIRGREAVYEVSYENVPRSLQIEAKEEGLELKVNKLSGHAGDNYFIYFHKGKVHIIDIATIEPIKDFLLTMGRYDDRTAFIEKEDVKGFCRYLLPALKEHFKVRRINFNEEDYGMEPAAFRFYLDAPERDHITCRTMVQYGDLEVNLYSRENSDLRDLAAEKKVNKAVSAYFTAYNGWQDELVLAQDDDRLYELLAKGLADLANYGEIYLSERLKKINVVSRTTVKLGVSITSNLMELTLDSGDMSRGELIEILSNYNPKKKYYRMRNGDFVNVENDELEILHGLKKGLNLTEKMLEQDAIELPKYRALFVDEQLKKAGSIPVSKEKNYKALIRNFKTVEENEFELPTALESILRGYQKSGFLWMKTLHANGFGGILADDMGLGKTLQVISFLKSEMETNGEMGKALVVCPASLVYNWRSEFEKFAPQMNVTTVTGLPEEREALIAGAAEGEILVTSYDLLKRDIRCYKETVFGYQIIDEAQYIKNHNTQASKAVKAVRAGFKLALTGTPIENRLSELWSVFEYLMPGFLFPYNHFKKEMELPIVQGNDLAAVSRLQQMVSPFVLRRLKRDVLTDLPDKIEENVIVPIEGEQRHIYDARVVQLQEMLSGQTPEEFNTSKIKVLAELTRLRQICCDPRLVYDNYKDISGKMAICLDLISEAVEGGHKVLLFSQFTSLFEAIHRHLDSMKISYFTLTGETSKEKRLELVEDFNQDDTSVFCISLKAGGTGLNLTAADIVIHFDPWWNVAAQNQATDRAHRIGQQNVVNVYKLIAKNTIEEKIVQLQEAKKELADQVLSGENIGSAVFTKEELLEILK